MSGSNLLTISQAARCLHNGRIVAYPTEAVYGLGCDPANESAVQEILRLKDRPVAAGLILIADQFDRFIPYIGPISQQQRVRAMSAWPGPVTWLFPRAENVPDWLAGQHSTIALRLTAHPGCRALCAAFEGAIVSTSANPGGSEPARNAGQVGEYFGDFLCGVLEGTLGDEQQPSEIRDLVSGKVIRSA